MAEIGRRRFHNRIILLHAFLLGAFTIGIDAAPKIDNQDRRNLSITGQQKEPQTIRGVWRVTKYVSLLGPTVSIYFYNTLHNFFEKHGPILSARFQEVVQKLQSGDEREYTGSELQAISFVGANQENAYVLKVANEVIRITNTKLREKAVVSRIQMDEDQYELSRRHASTDVSRVAIAVLDDVLRNGCGAVLTPEDKSAVRSMILASIGEYAMDRSWRSDLRHSV